MTNRRLRAMARALAPAYVRSHCAFRGDRATQLGPIRVARGSRTTAWTRSWLLVVRKRQVDHGRLDRDLEPNVSELATIHPQCPTLPIRAQRVHCPVVPNPRQQAGSVNTCRFLAIYFWAQRSAGLEHPDYLMPRQSVIVSPSTRRLFEGNPAVSPSMQPRGWALIVFGTHRMGE